MTGTHVDSPSDMKEILEKDRVWCEPMMEFDACDLDYMEEIFYALRETGLEGFLIRKPSFFLPRQVAEAYLNSESVNGDIRCRFIVHSVGDPARDESIIKQMFYSLTK